eukprot:gene25666-46753_t
MKPPPPPPPDVPALEEAAKGFGGREPKLSEMLAVHRENKLCNSCHERMDPLGLAFENFTALGTWRETEAGQNIEVAGRLVTGERFASVRELKRILTHERRFDYYRCLTEKLLTYALGRGLTYRDTDTVDRIVEALERDVAERACCGQFNFVRAVPVVPRPRQGFPMKNQPTVAPSDLATPRHRALSRRQFLRGVGVTMALPLFESTLPGRLRA